MFKIKKKGHKIVDELIHRAMSQKYTVIYMHTKIFYCIFIE